MLLKDTHHLIGVDIRANSILAIELAGSGKRCRLKRIGQTKLPERVKDETVVDDPVIVSEALTTLFRKKKFGTRYVALAVNGLDVTVKNLSIKRVDLTLLHDRILRIAEQYVPYPLASMYLDYRVLGNSVHQPGQMDVLMVAAPKLLVNTQVKTARMAHLLPVVVDLAPLAAANCYAFNKGTTKPAILFGLDAQSIAVTVVEAGALRFTRHVEIDLSAKPDGAQLAKVFYETTNRFLESDMPQDIDKVYLYGNLPQLATHKNEFAKEADIEVELLDPFGHISIPSKRMTFESEPLTGPQAAIGVGLALRKGVS